MGSLVIKSYHNPNVQQLIKEKTSSTGGESKRKLPSKRADTQVNVQYGGGFGGSCWYRCYCGCGRGTARNENLKKYKAKSAFFIIVIVE